MPDETDRRKIEQLAEQLDDAVSQARAASEKAEALRREVAELTAKADRLQQEIATLKESTALEGPKTE